MCEGGVSFVIIFFSMKSDQESIFTFVRLFLMCF